MRRAVAALVVLAAAAPLAFAQTVDHGAEIGLRLARMQAEGRDTGMVLPVRVRAGAAMPRTAQVTLECLPQGRRVGACEVVSEAPEGLGLGESLAGQSAHVWMRTDAMARAGTVRVLFDITQGMAVIGRSDPVGAMLLPLKGQPAERSGFRALDANRDGKLDEREAYVMDADRDRYISRAEFETHFRFEPGGPGPSYGAFDSDFDGRVTINNVIDRYRPGSMEDIAP